MKDNLENIFEKFENQFDIEEPNIGHFNRFESKLNKPSSRKKIIKLISTISIAASITLLIGIWIGSSNSNQGMELANVSIEMQETQSFFINTINNELSKIENERNSDTEQIIIDGFAQIQKLEKQYQLLSLELKESAEDKRVIYAMISNFQQRIDVLQGLLEQIENVKQLKTQNDEKYV